ncbi:MAG: EVE domain-containing protein [Alphaproteobacteria bacterium]|nr:EVE domain-containing protein [Alphaproteobacteria bacterium]MCW5740740.1 EVE domain-containing protein [Alphaproteobacteria bacterium]
MTSYWSNLFTVETWAAFESHGSNISGFRERQRTTALKIQPGDRFICYLVHVSRWCGVFEIVSAMFEDRTPIFADPDPFVLRFRVKPIVALKPQFAIPIFEPDVWNGLQITRDLPIRSQSWAQHANLRGSLRPLTEADGSFLISRLQRQAIEQRLFELTPQELRRVGGQSEVRTLDRKVLVEVPEDRPEEALEVEVDVESTRESHLVQAKVAEIGAKMNFRIWIPRNDRQKVKAIVGAAHHAAFLEELPLNYDDATLRTIEQIDVIWLRNRSMTRAFEIEHTTAIYSGLLRMADLLALQPNMDIAVSIVAPDARREKVLKEIKRPVFSLLESGPLYESCSYIPYSAIESIAAERFLAHMNESILEEYEDFAEEV